MNFSRPMENSWRGQQPWRILRFSEVGRFSAGVSELKPQPPTKPTNSVVLGRATVKSTSGSTHVGNPTTTTLPIICGTVRDATKLPKINNEEIKVPESGTSYEEFLIKHTLTARREGICNRNRSNYFLLPSQGMRRKDVDTLQAIDQKQKSLKQLESTFDIPCRSPWLSEYEDKFGSLMRQYPLHIPHPPPRRLWHSKLTNPSLLRKGPIGKGPWSEYQANYNTTIIF